MTPIKTDIVFVGSPAPDAEIQEILIWAAKQALEGKRIAVALQSRGAELFEVGKWAAWPEVFKTPHDALLIPGAVGVASWVAADADSVAHWSALVVCGGEA